MASETFTFSCPHCQTRLTVPVSLAGVSGPCPSCRTTITAPGPAAEPATIATPVAAPASPPVTPEDHVVPSALTDEELLAASGPRIRPEPRHLPERPPSPPISTRRSTEDRRAQRTEVAGPESTRRNHRLIHLLFPVTFLAMATTVVGALFYFYGPGAPGQRLKEATGPLVIQPSTRAEPPPRPQAEEKDAASAPPATTESPSGESPESVPSEVRSESPAVLAYALLESFLHAKDAASRVDMVEPATSEQDLAATLLKGPLPEVAQIYSEIPQHHPEEQMTDFPYRVSFSAKDSPNVDYAILVRQRGTQPPRVFLPAFLDLVGGRLAGFTREPNQLPPALFHVYLEPIDGCYEDVTGADRKFTFKLLSSPFGKEAARAYASNVSRCRTQVNDPSYPIRWAMKRRATITLQWNHKEDPAKPYLELIELNSPNWNP